MAWPANTRLVALRTLHELDHFFASVDPLAGVFDHSLDGYMARMHPSPIPKLAEAMIFNARGAVAAAAAAIDALAEQVAATNANATEVEVKVMAEAPVVAVVAAGPADTPTSPASVDSSSSPVADNTSSPTAQPVSNEPVFSEPVAFASTSSAVAAPAASADVGVGVDGAVPPAAAGDLPGTIAPGTELEQSPAETSTPVLSAVPESADNSAPLFHSD